LKLILYESITEHLFYKKKCDEDIFNQNKKVRKKTFFCVCLSEEVLIHQARIAFQSCLMKSIENGHISINIILNLKITDYFGVYHSFDFF